MENAEFPDNAFNENMKNGTTDARGGFFDSAFLKKHDAVLVVNSSESHDIINCNPAASELLGYSLREMINRGIGSLFEPDYLIKTVIATVNKQGFFYAPDFHVKHKNGEVLHVEKSVLPLKDNSGAIIAYLYILKKAPKNVSSPAPDNNEAVMRWVLDTIPASVFLKDTNGKYLLVNKALSGMLGVSGNAALGKTELELAGGDANKIIEAERRMANDKEVIDCKILQFVREEPFEMPDGSTRWLQTTRKPLVVDGRPVAIMGVSVDITDLKKNEKQLLAYHKKLRSLASEIADIEDRERRRIAGELHDRIGQNLAAAKLKLEILAGDYSQGDKRKDHEEVLRLIDQTIKDTYSLTFEISPPMLYELGLSPALEWLGERFQEQYKIRFSFKDDNNSISIENDKLGPVYQAVRELLINVAKHARAGNVRVSVSNSAGRIKLNVTDDGIGFNPDTGIKQGSRGGFGLFSIKERMNHLGGKLVIKSKPGAGSDITLVLPVNNDIKKKRVGENK